MKSSLASSLIGKPKLETDCLSVGDGEGGGTEEGEEDGGGGSGGSSGEGGIS